ncbi:MAG: helix-turn-helix protein [Hyphomonadaceae bacterium]|nr:MAG: helix-turn-helix protein [Hyphomonadaceae bacterium]KAF0185038.1 MAG: helix-turn-helix protein [Hyphomonadaceae bacterium]
MTQETGESELTHLGNAIRHLRLTNRSSQEEMADKAKLDRSYFGAIERGEHNLSLKNIAKIAQALEVSIADLFVLSDKFKNGELA